MGSIKSTRFLNCDPPPPLDHDPLDAGLLRVWVGGGGDALMTIAKDLAEKIFLFMCGYSATGTEDKAAKNTLISLESLLESAMEEHADNAVSQMNEVWDKRMDEAIFAERNRCAKIAESGLVQVKLEGKYANYLEAWSDIREAIAQSIRQPREEK